MTSTAARVEEFDTTQACDSAEINRIGEYHSALAMEAARKMRRTQKKRETGQAVCHHLKMMLASEPVPIHEISEREISRTGKTVNPNGRTPRPLHPEPQFTLFELP